MGSHRPIGFRHHSDPNVSRDERVTVAFGRLVPSLGLADLRFHDLRHDAASTLTMAGVPQRTIMALPGHRDPRLTPRYQHLSPEHFRDAVRAVDRSASETITQVATA